MSHTTLGIDIKSHAISYALCSFASNAQSPDIRATGTIEVLPTDTSDGLPEAFDSLSHTLEQFKGVQIDNIGLSLDPTLALYAHRSFPFNDPKSIEKILPQDLNDIWNFDNSSQIAFQIGEKIKLSSENGEADEEVYDVLALNYPYDKLAALLDYFKNSRIDPHLAIPATDALPYAMGTLIVPPQEAWALLDIGENYTIIALGTNDKIQFTRAIKVGSVNIDEAIAATFNISIEEARAMKEETGFIAVAQQENADYQRYLQEHRIAPWDVNPIALSKACNAGLQLLITALQQSVVNFSSKFHIEPECIYLSGGGAKLCGIDNWLSKLSGAPCYLGLPIRKELIATNPHAKSVAMDISAAAVAAAANANADGNCPLNLRKGNLVHKGSLAFIQDNKWLFASLIVALIIALIFMTSMRAKTVKTEHDKIKQALEQTTKELFGKKILNQQQITREFEDSEGYDFLPVRTAFTHFEWISNNVNDNLADIEMDLSGLDIDTQRKIVTIKGEVAGDDGLPRFMQLLEQYECFPNEIQEPKTTKIKEKTSFTLRVEANHCAMGGESE